MAPYFFRVEHDLLRSEAFKTLGGSAIKVYLVIGLYSDFGTDWAYPSIRTIATQSGLSRQTVLTAVEELTQRGLLAASKSKGRSTAYRVIRQAPERPAAGPKKSRKSTGPTPPTTSRPAVPLLLEGDDETGPESLAVSPSTGQNSFGALAHFFGPAGPEGRPYQEPAPREDTNT